MLSSPSARAGIELAIPGSTARERGLLRVLQLASALAALGLLAVFAVALWARNGLTPVEGIVGLHSHMFAQGQGLYHPLNQYPYTVAAYGPIYYSLCAALDRLGVPLYLAARSLSFLALLGSLWYCGRILARFAPHDRPARTVGLLLAASTANLLYWGTVGQVDMLAVCFSLAAFAAYLDWRATGRGLWLAAAFVVLAVFTKQTAIASGATIALCLLWDDRRTAARWIPAVALAGLAIAATLQLATQGAFLENALFANLNPFAAAKLIDQGQYFLLTSGGLLLIGLCCLPAAIGPARPLFLYTGLSLAVWLLTAPKVGSDLNYQLEMTLLLAVTAAVGLGHAHFFSAVFANRRSAITLLQIPIVLHIALNLTLTARTAAERAVFESAKTAEIEALRPFLAAPHRRVLGGSYDATLQLRGHIEVETLIYSLLVAAGRVDPGPVLRDLQAGRFETVVLPFDVTSGQTPAWLNAELTPLPPAQLDAVRTHYRLVKHLDGAFLNGNYIYEPIRH
jgi:hypothetical protein